MTGAVSFRRWLGCAPMIIARAQPPRRNSSARATASLIITEGERAGSNDARISPARRPPPRRDLHCRVASLPDESVRFLGVVCRVVLKNSLAVFLIAQPNGCA